MLKHKYRNQALLLLILAIIATAVFWFNNKNSTLPSTSKDFTFNAFYRIENIRITNKDTSLMLNKEKGNTWQVNDQFPVNNQSFKALKSIFSGLETVAPLPKIDKARITEKLFSEGTKIELLENSRPVKTYHFYFDTINNRTYGSLDNKKAIFSLRIKAVDVLNIPKYLSTRTGYWKDNHIFKHTPDEIRTIHVHYPDDPGQSFTVRNKGQQPVVLDQTGDTVDNVAIEKVTNYLYYFSSVKYDAVIDTADFSVSSPFASIQVIHKTDTSDLQLYRIPSANETKKYNLNELLGKTNFEYCRLKYPEIDPVLQKRNFFQAIP